VSPDIKSGPSRSSYGCCWPTKDQALLLRACLLNGEDAINAFQDWKSSVKLDYIDPGSYRLFPLLYKNLTSNSVEDPLINIFKWVYDRTKSNNSILFRNVSSLLGQFKGYGIEVILLKGTGLVLTSYRDYGLRPMMDVDLLVPTKKTGDAIRLITGLGWSSSLTPLKGFTEVGLLSRLGWTPVERRLEEFSEEYFCVRHGQDFTNMEKFTIDLHWHVLNGYNDINADVQFWESALGVIVDGVPGLVLDPADQLLQVCTHGICWNAVPPIRWVADATSILNNGNEWIDWDRLVTGSKRHGVVLPIREALKYLNPFLKVPIPDYVLMRLEAEPVSHFENIKYKIRNRIPGILDGFLELCILYRNYSKMSRGKNFIRKIGGFPKFLQHVLGMNCTWHLVLYSVFEFVRRGLKIPKILIKSIVEKTGRR